MENTVPSPVQVAFVYGAVEQGEEELALSFQAVKFLGPALALDLYVTLLPLMLVDGSNRTTKSYN